jgi:hypothetical protein
VKKQQEKKERHTPNTKSTNMLCSVTKVCIDIQYLASLDEVALGFLDFLTVCVRPSMEFEF